MKQFSAFEYILIDMASHWGLDKLTFEERLSWGLENMDNFERICADKGNWKERPLFIKGLQALRNVQAGVPVGHVVGMDAVCSGMQILSVVTGCEAGAHSTGLVDPNLRADAYTKCTRVMQRALPGMPDGLRQDIKDAVMTCLYGSSKIPKDMFGAGTIKLEQFYKALLKIAPGACMMLDLFKSIWQAYALDHAWVLPDNHHARVPVSDMVDTKIEIDELDHAQFAYRYEKVQGQKKGLSLIANVTHSLDAYVLRTLIRRCNYDVEMMWKALHIIQEELLSRAVDGHEVLDHTLTEYFTQITTRYNKCGIADISIIPHLDAHNLYVLSTQHLLALKLQINQIVATAPFEVICIHDEFKCHPGHMNELRAHYREILAQLAESTVLDDIVSQITGKRFHFKKLSSKLPEKIRQSNYALC